MIHVISVSKSYIHRGNHRHRHGTKKHWHMYYVDDDGKFKTKRISSLEAVYYKALKLHRYRYICINCGFKFIALVKSHKDAVECPYCT
ncbi:MAG: hypothetical protein EB150_10370 [Nitrososphaeria archaeon]|nr:hypothetical protein [Nitrososphaeria archaeon]NDB63908.1 hypothetical protein [Nitrosopumilaceae archaeon]NDB89115.1 hypothetical protein [Nitrososphaerota archaeon]NDF25833.1 hypothetical protein [Nitrososphaerota archaeon]NDF30579.1 hypothetical protein [Nitrososphaeria archaeon]